MHFKRLAKWCPCYHPHIYSCYLSHLTCNKMPTLAPTRPREGEREREKSRWTLSQTPRSQTVIFIASSQVSNMFHQWQFENIWSQSNATFNCSKLNLIDSPTNSCLLKASSIRSWFFRLLNFLWFHPRFDIQLRITFSSRRKIENAFQGS